MKVFKYYITPHIYIAKYTAPRTRKSKACRICEAREIWKKNNAATNHPQMAVHSRTYSYPITVKESSNVSGFFLLILMDLNHYAINISIGNKIPRIGLKEVDTVLTHL